MQFWIEKTLIRGAPDRERKGFAVGQALLSPARSQDGRDLYRFMREIRAADVVLHLTDNTAITMLSIASSAVQSIYRGNEEWYVVPLRNAKRLEPPLHRNAFFADPYGPELLDLLAKGLRQTFYTRDLRLQQGKYLTPVPESILAILDRAYGSATGRSILDIVRALEQER